MALQHINKQNFYGNMQNLDPNDINIVLVGETGVGKSTFINAFVNYLKFESLEEASTSSNVFCLIASKFTVADENFDERVVRFGDDENECIAVGASSTQSSRSYRFSVDQITVRLIDTPGIGDTRGIAKDEENFDRLLNVLSELKYVHAFCILLKPNSAKLTVLFQYCIKQLLSRLDKSASRNIVFVFTNSRSTFYKPGDTIGPLKEILKNVKSTPPNVEIPFSLENVFCMDNEAFRFLLASREGIHFSDNEKRDFSTSWEKSADVSIKLLTYVCNLTPHKIQDTISINEARRLILNLSEPLALVAKNIDDNLRSIRRKQEELSDENKTVNELKELLYFDMIRISVTQLNHPRTVCTHENCTDVHIVEGSKHINYKQICHDPCYLKEVPKEVIGSPLIQNCAAMSYSTCKHCKHNYTQHMHIYFLTEPYTNREIDKKVDADIKVKTGLVREIEALISRLQIQKNVLEKEKEIVQKSMAKFAHFLNNNAITPYNDKYQEYIRYLIENENSQGPLRDANLVRSYEELIRTHKEQTYILDSQLREVKEQDTNAIVISSEHIVGIVSKLFQLEINGPLIHDFYIKQQHVRQQESLLHTEKHVDAGLWRAVKKRYNQIAPRRLQLT